MGIAPNDLNTKLKSLQRLLLKGHTVKLSVQLFGRHQSRQDLGRSFFNDVLAQTTEYAKEAGTRSKDGLSTVLKLKE